MEELIIEPIEDFGLSRKQQQSIERPGIAIERPLRQVEFLDVIGAGKSIRSKKGSKRCQLGHDENPDRQITRQTWACPCERRVRCRVCL